LKYVAQCGISYVPAVREPVASVCRQEVQLSSCWCLLQVACQPGAA